MQVNHVNRRRWDNRLANLELVTGRHNVCHAFNDSYVAVSDADGDHCVSTEWFSNVVALAERGDVTPAEIRALNPSVAEGGIRPLYTGARQLRGGSF
jgi:hypothetical protein